MIATRVIFICTQCGIINKALAMCQTGRQQTKKDLQIECFLCVS